MKREESIDADYLAPAKYDQYYGAYATLPDWFLTKLASREKVLELACGTGRIAIPLAEHGLEVTGIDYSEPMLSLAKSKADGRQVKINWIHDDIRRFNTGKQYGSILLLSNALWHLHDLADFEECIRCVKRHLAPGGYFILDVFVPGLKILNRDPSRRYPFSRYTDDKTGQEVQVTQSYKYEADTQIALMVHYREDSDEIVGGLNLRMYFPQELDALLKYNGMRINEKFGNWDREVFRPDSKHQLYFCTTMETG
jgi:SAM-dependent methyltransferase